MILRLIFLFLLLIVGGTSGYMVIEDWSWLDAFYMTVITLTTTGFQEVHQLSYTGKLFTILILIGGVGLLTYIVTTLIQIITEGEYKKAFGRRKMKKMCDMIKNHTIVCGFGRMGKAICEEFHAKKNPFIVIEIDESLEPELQEKGYPYIIGDSSSEEVLTRAQIDKAKSLVSITSSDPQNVYTVLTARFLNKHIYIVTRALDQKSQKKILNAGAHKVVCPYSVASRSIAKTILDPAAEDFIDFTLGRNFEVELADILVHSKSSLVGKTIQASEIRKKGIIIVGIKQNNGEILFAPSPQRKIEEDERIIALGPSDAIKDFNASVEA